MLTRGVYKMTKKPNSKERIIKVACDLAIKNGYQKLTRELIAEYAETSIPLINYYYGGIENVKDEVLKYAIKNEIVPILAQGLSLRDKRTLKISQALKNKASQYIKNSG